MRAQNYWVDRTIALCGVVMAAVPAINLSGLLDIGISARMFNLLVLGVGLVLIGAMAYRLKTKSYSVTTGLSHDQFYARLKDVVRRGSRVKVVICSPDSTVHGKEFIAHCCERQVGISILGSSSQLKVLIETLGCVPSIHDKLNVTRFSNEFSVIVVYDDSSSRVSVACISRDEGMMIRFAGSVVEAEIRRLVEQELLKNSHPIQLGGIAHPQVFLNVVDQKTRNFLDNFANLKSGEITFLNSEVINIQSGWLEGGDFRTIRTLDRTGDPARLLGRTRYLQANEDFVARAGRKIQRVFMIERKRLQEEEFSRSLEALAIKQIDMGIEVDIRYLSELGESGAEDFILYDNYAVLVEKQQASEDYKSASSVAYFGHGRIQAYEHTFDQVWRGGRTKRQILEILKG